MTRTEAAANHLLAHHFATLKLIDREEPGSEYREKRFAHLMVLVRRTAADGGAHFTWSEASSIVRAASRRAGALDR